MDGKYNCTIRRYSLHNTDLRILYKAYLHLKMIAKMSIKVPDNSIILFIILRMLDNAVFYNQLFTRLMCNYQCYFNVTNCSRFTAEGNGRQ